MELFNWGQYVEFKIILSPIWSASSQTGYMPGSVPRSCQCWATKDATREKAREEKRNWHSCCPGQQDGICGLCGTSDQAWWCAGGIREVGKVTDLDPHGQKTEFPRRKEHRNQKWGWVNGGLQEQEIVGKGKEQRSMVWGQGDVEGMMERARISWKKT